METKEENASSQRTGKKIADKSKKTVDVQWLSEKKTASTSKEIVDELWVFRDLLYHVTLTDSRVELERDYHIPRVVAYNAACINADIKTISKKYDSDHYQIYLNSITPTEYEAETDTETSQEEKNSLSNKLVNIEKQQKQDLIDVLESCNAIKTYLNLKINLLRSLDSAWQIYKRKKKEKLKQAKKKPLATTNRHLLHQQPQKSANKKTMLKDQENELPHILLTLSKPRKF